MERDREKVNQGIHRPAFLRSIPTRAHPLLNRLINTHPIMGRNDKGKATADEEAPPAAPLEVSTPAGDGGAAPAPAAPAPSPFGLSSRDDFKRAASVPLGFTCLMTNQVRRNGDGMRGGEREREAATGGACEKRGATAKKKNVPGHPFRGSVANAAQIGRRCVLK